MDNKKLFQLSIATITSLSIQSCTLHSILGLPTYEDSIKGKTSVNETTWVDDGLLDQELCGLNKKEIADFRKIALPLSKVNRPLQPDGLLKQNLKKLYQRTQLAKLYKVNIVDNIIILDNGIVAEFDPNRAFLDIPPVITKNSEINTNLDAARDIVQIPPKADNTVNSLEYNNFGQVEIRDNQTAKIAYCPIINKK